MTRPDMAFVTCLWSSFIAWPTDLHLQIAKRALRYFKGTFDFGIRYKRAEKEFLKVYTDSYYAGNLEDRKSASGYDFVLNSGAVAWRSKKQPIVTLSTTEAKFIAAAVCMSYNLGQKSYGGAWQQGRRMYYRLL